MSKKVKILISALVVAALLTVGATATVLAEGEDEDEDTPTVTEEEIEEGFLDRVADILGIEKEDLISAFKQARQEIYEESFINRVNEAVEEGLIAQEQADEIIEWWLQRPDEALREWRGQKPECMEPGMLKHKFTLRFRATPRFHMRNGSGGLFCPELPGQTD